MHAQVFSPKRRIPSKRHVTQQKKKLLCVTSYLGIFGGPCARLCLHKGGVFVDHKCCPTIPTNLTPFWTFDSWFRCFEQTKFCFVIFYRRPQH